MIFFHAASISYAQLISTGWYHTLVVCSNGTAQSWGQDAFGQLGDNAAIASQPTPVAVASLTTLIAVAGGGNHTLALKSNGSVWSCGYDVYGQLGDNAALANQSTPVQVSGLTGITAISAGNNHSLALKNDGTVWSWGNDSYGQLGDNASLTDQPTPVQVSGLTGITAISGGWSHSLALKNDGTVWAWGRDNYGQLGDNASLTNQPTPVQVSGLTGIIYIAAGYGHSLAVKNDGTVWSWGWDAMGQLGDNASLTDQPTPVQVSGLTGMVSVAAGNNHSFARKNDNTLWAWGYDFYGQLGDGGSNTDQPTPVQVTSLTGVMAVSGGYMHSLALKGDGTVWAWGRDNLGQLGDNAALVDQSSPVLVGSCAMTPLSVNLTAFTAIKNGLQNILEWTTASEINNDVFIVERSNNGEIFETAGLIKGSGNSSGIRNYEFTDTDPGFAHSTAYYRLRQVDFSGNSMYSQTISVAGLATPAILIYPSPVYETLHLLYSAGENCISEIAIFNVSGNLVMKERLKTFTGENHFEFTTDNYNPGIYFLEITNNYRTTRLKFSIQ